MKTFTFGDTAFLSDKLKFLSIYLSMCVCYHVHVCDHCMYQEHISAKERPTPLRTLEQRRAKVYGCEYMYY